MIEQFANWFAYSLLSLDAQSAVGSAVQFFVYDSIKILLLLFGVSTVMGVVNACFPVSQLRHYLLTHRLYGLQYVLASVFGALTPFCSCSSIPLFIGFVKGGIPLGVTLAFLITSPLVNEVAVAMFLGTFGLKVTAVYVLSGIALGCAGGWLLGRMHLDGWLSRWVLDMQEQPAATASSGSMWQGLRERLPYIVNDAWGIVRGVLLYVLVGIGIGAWMHGYVPAGYFAEMLSADRWYAVPLSVVCAVPLYANAAGIVPIMQVLVAKGVPLGTALSFMMATVGLSLPEATMLTKVMTWRLIALFFTTVAVCIIALGFLFNAVL